MTTFEWERVNKVDKLFWVRFDKRDIIRKEVYLITDLDLWLPVKHH